MSTALHLEDTVEVEYVGDPNPLDEFVKIRIALGHIPESAANVLRVAALKRHKAIKGVNIRVVEPEHFGTSRPYTFGPHNFVQRVLKKDYERIKQSKSAHQFKLAGSQRDPLVLPRDGEDDIVMVGVEQFGQQESVHMIEQSLQRRR